MRGAVDAELVVVIEDDVVVDIVFEEEVADAVTDEDEDWLLVVLEAKAVLQVVGVLTPILDPKEIAPLMA